MKINAINMIGRNFFACLMIKKTIKTRENYQINLQQTIITFQKVNKNNNMFIQKQKPNIKINLCSFILAIKSLIQK